MGKMVADPAVYSGILSRMSVIYVISTLAGREFCAESPLFPAGYRPVMARNDVICTVSGPCFGSFRPLWDIPTADPAGNSGLSGPPRVKYGMCVIDPFVTSERYGQNPLPYWGISDPPRVESGGLRTLKVVIWDPPAPPGQRFPPGNSSKRGPGAGKAVKSGPGAGPPARITPWKQ